MRASKIPRRGESRGLRGGNKSPAALCESKGEMATKMNTNLYQAIPIFFFSSLCNSEGGGGRERGNELGDEVGIYWPL